jgi:catechol 2,3-dioxygenase-like lactoylglutathione lyase family enzyme
MKIRNVIFYVKDIDLSKKFYEKLGFKLVEDFGKFISFETSDNQTFFSLMQPDVDDSIKVPGKQVCAISVVDIDEEWKKVKKLGLVIAKELIEESFGRTFAIRDLDGNKIEYIEMEKGKVKTIKKEDVKIVDLSTKIIKKYTADDKRIEINKMSINGRNPENPKHFIYETECRFMVYVLKGSGKLYCDEEVFEVSEGDVVDVPTHAKFAAEGIDFEYLTFEAPAWFPSQAFIVDDKGNIIEETKV